MCNVTRGPILKISEIHTDFPDFLQIFSNLHNIILWTLPNSPKHSH